MPSAKTVGPLAFTSSDKGQPMSRALTTLLVLTACSAGALAAPVEKRDYFPGNLDDLPCAVRIEFASSARGPDYTTWDAMRSYIADSKDIQRAEAWGWRNDGEFLLCLQIEEREAITTVFNDLSNIAPKTPPASVGQTTVALGKTATR